MKRFAAVVKTGGLYAGDGKEVPIGTELKVTEAQAKMLGSKIELGPEVVGDEEGKEAVVNDDQKEPEKKDESTVQAQKDADKGQDLKLPEPKATK
jgi:hypothetical protein